MKYLSLSEAEEKGFGMYESLKKACQRHEKTKGKSGLRCYKIGKYWVTTKEALRTYNNKNKENYE